MLTCFLIKALLPYHRLMSCTILLQDSMKLMDDLVALRPTIFASVPRLYNRIYSGYI
jgi:long-subunit acyl-CoA synthetase (AMP-forming)